MKKSSLRRIEAAAGNGGGYGVPSDAAINITETLTAPMAVELKVVREFSATAAVFGDVFDYAGDLVRVTFWEVVDAVTACSSLGKAMKNVSHGRRCVNRGSKRNREAMPCQVDKPVASLGDAIVCGIEDPVISDVAEGFELLSY